MISRKYDYYLPVTLVSYTKPTVRIKCILRILLSLGSFELEIDLTTHGSIYECLWYENLIGPSHDHSVLEKYSDNLLIIYI